MRTAIKTKAALVPPNKKPPKRIGAAYGDFIHDLAEKIIGLSKKDRVELVDYLKSQGLYVNFNNRRV